MNKLKILTDIWINFNYYLIAWVGLIQFSLLIFGGIGSSEGLPYDDVLNNQMYLFHTILMVGGIIYGRINQRFDQLESKVKLNNGVKVL